MALSFILLICLIFTIYILYINYNKEKTLSQNEIDFENNLKTEINKNSELISKISDNLEKNDIKLEEIKKSIFNLTTKDNNEDIYTLNQNIDLLNSNFNKLSDEINKLKNNNASLKKTNEIEIINNGINDVVNLIMIKYENGIKFDGELEYLKKIIDDNKIPNFEKISILALDSFKGYEYLKQLFNEEISNHLKIINNKNPNSLFSKIVLPYINVSPSSENTITNDFILKIKLIKLNIENKNLEAAHKNLRLVDQFDSIFKSSLLEINKYIKFEKELFSLL